MTSTPQALKSRSETAYSSQVCSLRAVDAAEAIEHALDRAEQARQRLPLALEDAEHVGAEERRHRQRQREEEEDLYPTDWPSCGPQKRSG